MTSWMTRRLTVDGVSDDTRVVSWLTGPLTTLARPG
jgi:hypothetical protein